MKGIQGAQRGVLARMRRRFARGKVPARENSRPPRSREMDAAPQERETRDALERFEELKADYPLTTQYRTFSNSTAFGRLSLA